MNSVGEDHERLEYGALESTTFIQVHCLKHYYSIIMLHQ